jgi:hypothetical protein
MRVRFSGSLLICCLVAAGCGSSSSNNDAHDGASDGKDAGSDARNDKGDTITSSDSGSGDAGSEDAPADASSGGDAATDGNAIPTCSDGIKNSDETGVDCGGHCGKCGPGQPCVLATDCQFAVCKTDGMCGACASASDCPGVESECQHRTCTAGVCGMDKVAAATVLTVQPAGDCQRRQCDGAGAVQTVPDNTDLPDDRNPCTNDLCTSGTPSHTLVAANTNCGGANTCNASGQCVGCGVASDCPGSDTPCRTRTCSATGVCGFAFVAAGTKLADPTAGDCKGVQCDGQGNSAIVNDDADVPADSNPCTNDSCNAGTPSHQAVASGTACGGSLVCDGAGSCVECTSAITCPGTDTECHTRTCIGNHCGVRNAAAGTALAAQTAKDCKTNQCDGVGGTQTVPDDTDLPVDDNACTSDVCTQGIPSNPFVTAGTTCAVDQICDGNGACVGCVIAANCPGADTECHTRTCVAHTCGVSNAAAGTVVFTQTAGDCKKNQCDGNGAVTAVADDTDKPVDGNACTQDLCANGTPSNPDLASGTTCGTNLVCNGSGACVGCVVAADCPGTDTTCQHRVCTNGQCGVSNAAAGTVLPNQTVGDCKKDQCDGNGAVTTVADDTDKHVDGNACTQDLCSQGLVSNPPEAAGFACSQGGGNRCNGSSTAPACVQCLQASDCSGTDTECHVRTCTAGVCGVSNTAAGTVVAGQMTGDCKKNICDGNGAIVSAVDNTDVLVDGNACTMDLCANGVPSNPAAAAGAPCTQGGGTRCNGSSTAPACVQCLQASDCPGTDTECHVRTCTAGVCGVSNAASGTVVADQTAGDCHKNVCNGSGGVIAAIDNSDVRVDGNSCTADLCISGVASNPPVATGTACAQNGGSFCDATGACVQCLVASTCPGGPDTTCHTRACTNGTCAVTNAAAGTLVTNAPAGNCHKDVCDGNGNVTTQVDDTDLPVDGNLCTSDLCANGAASNPPLATGTSCGTGLICDGYGACVGCVTAADCPGSDSTCQQRTCTNHQCATSNAAVGTFVSGASVGDCQKIVCDGYGNTATVPDDSDLPANTNACVSSVCTSGVPSSPPKAQGTTCNQDGGNECDGNGHCVQCVTAADCPGGPDTECSYRTCSTKGVCGIVTPGVETVLATQTTGDCQTAVCDGSGGTTTIADDLDVPVNTNQCATVMCTGGAVSTTNSPHGTTCTQNGGRTCDGSGSCFLTFSVVVIGDGSTTLTSAAMPVSVEEHKLDGTLLGTTKLPIAAASGNFPFANSGTAKSEGALSLSGDGRYLSLAGYNATPGTASVGSAGGIPREVARIDAAGAVDTTTQITAAFLGDNFRGATSQDGTGFWISGGNGGTASSAGLWFVNLGSSGTATQLVTAPADTRVVHVFGGQLYGTSNITNFKNVFTVGAGLPAVATPTVTALPGMPTSSTPSPYSFVLFDRDATVAGYDTLYVADDGSGSVKGIQKWTLGGAGTWSRVATFNLATAVGFRGLAGIVTGSSVTLIATTDDSVPRLVVFVETGGTATSTVLPASATNTLYRGVALSPHL